MYYKQMFQLLFDFVDVSFIILESIEHNLFIGTSFHVPNHKQETAEDSKAGLSQFDLENQQYQGQGYHRNQ